MNEITYEHDFYSWTMEQAQLLRERRFAEIDVANIAEELESLGRSEHRELVSRLEVLLTHLLRWQFQAHRRRVVGNAAWWSWRGSIVEQRLRLTEHLQDNPSLQPRLPQAMSSAYRIARVRAEAETRIALAGFPESCPWTFEQIMAEDFWPAS